jgi:hypothetical protein
MGRLTAKAVISAVEDSKSGKKAVNLKLKTKLIIRESTAVSRKIRVNRRTGETENRSVKSSQFKVDSCHRRPMTYQLKARALTYLLAFTAFLSAVAS